MRVVSYMYMYMYIPRHPVVGIIEDEEISPSQVLCDENSIPLHSPVAPLHVTWDVTVGEKTGKTDGQMNRQTDRRIDRQTDRQMNRQTDRRIDRQTDR